MQLSILSFYLLTGFGSIYHVTGQQWPLNRYHFYNPTTHTSCLLVEFTGRLNRSSDGLILQNGSLLHNQTFCTESVIRLAIANPFISPQSSFIWLNFAIVAIQPLFLGVDVLIDNVTFTTRPYRIYAVASIGHTFRCNTGITIPLTQRGGNASATLELRSVRFNAFRRTNNSDFEPEIPCYPDWDIPTDPTVPTVPTVPIVQSKKSYLMIIVFVLGGIAIIVSLGYIIIHQQKSKSVPPSPSPPPSPLPISVTKSTPQVPLLEKSLPNLASKIAPLSPLRKEPLSPSRTSSLSLSRIGPLRSFSITNSSTELPKTRSIPQRSTIAKQK